LDILSLEDVSVSASAGAQTAARSRGLLREDLRPWQIIIINLSGPIALLVLSSLVLGLAPTSRSFFLGFSHVLAGAVSPFAVGKDLASAFLRLAQEQLLVAAAVLAVKVAAFNCLPLGYTNGGAVCIQLLRWARCRDVSTSLHMWFFCLGYLLNAVLCAGWFIAIVAALSEGVIV
jgi:membrane-associated protease RseP (regulator of RpoE activity)